MNNSSSAIVSRDSLRAIGMAVGVSSLLASLAVVSAHSVRGLSSPDSVGAFVSSPTATNDPLIPILWGIEDTGLRVACFNVANTSLSNADRPGWPRITGVGFELPGSLSGFALLNPQDEGWKLVEGTAASLPGHGSVDLDFAIVADVNPTGRTPGQPDDPLGIPPGQPAQRGAGTRFCVSGPFPDTLPVVGATTIERVLNGVVVEFDGVDDHRRSSDAGVWHPSAGVPRAIPLYQ